jgi:ribosomal protein L32
MEPVSFCPHCGHVLERGERVCPGCGIEIVDPPRFESLSFEEVVENSFLRLEKVALRGYERRLEVARLRLEELDRELEQIIELAIPSCRQ